MLVSSKEPPQDLGSAISHNQNLVTEHEVACLTAMSVATVRRWRLLGQGPKFIKLGSAVRYRPEDISAWFRSRPTGGDSAK
jgi:predicted DNA-binding transcriptional regulator AlpA